MKRTATSWSLALVAWLAPQLVAGPSSAPSGKPARAEIGGATLQRYCLDCHDAETAKGDLDLSSLLNEPAEQQSAAWEQVIRRLATRQMPPAATKARPTEAEYEQVLGSLISRLDAAARANPQPGRTETIRRLNRTEYQNAIRDLLSLEIDATALLPADEASHGFDNVTVGTLSATLLERYLSAAQKISRLAVGTVQRVPGGDTIRIRPDLTQDGWIEGLPFGTRGGAVISYTFPRTGEYEIAIRLARDRNDEVEGLRESHELRVLLNREEVQSFTIKPPAAGAGHNDIDTHLKFRLNAPAGQQALGVTFLKNPTSLLETKRQPYEAHFNFHRHPRLGPAVYQISITGPWATAEAGESASRQRIFVDRPDSTRPEAACARKIIGSTLRRAWRRPVNARDVARIFPFYEEARQEGDFEAGIEAALSAILVSREFLFRVEIEPKNLPAGAAYPLSDVELASRISFFLWSSLPDEELLELAERHQLHHPKILEQQVRRMLSDPRAAALTRNFASQWLQLRNLDSVSPDARLFPDFDDNLRQAMRQETELLFEEIRTKDRSVLELLRTDHTWLNERLAKHYGIPHVYGPQFRRVALNRTDHRGGLLRHASVLTVTSYANRTSPVLRGKWVLENLLGTPPAPPPPNVPALDGGTVLESLAVRQRLAAHRDKPACAGCHAVIDPPGFALENFDAVGRWRVREEGTPVDAEGGLPDGQSFVGVDGLEAGLLHRPDLFATALTEKLLTFALGRGVEPFDAPTVREIVRAARASGYPFSTLVAELVRSPAFTQRQSL